MSRLAPIEPALSEQEERLRKLYGNRLPTTRGVLNQKLKERKYFDSGDYALSKAGKTTGPVGSQHPQPENIPHSNPYHHGSPPVKESSLIHQTESASTSIAQPNA
ncbi:hypothetical protein BGX31_007460 [Mortierella sp. GBA43]|nr:hypothetical protein BGX31_007460 [Mortierella sp. GBA43]